MYNLGCMEEDQLANITATFKEGQTGPFQLRIYILQLEE